MGLHLQRQVSYDGWIRAKEWEMIMIDQHISGKECVCRCVCVCVWKVCMNVHTVGVFRFMVCLSAYVWSCICVYMWQYVCDRLGTQRTDVLTQSQCNIAISKMNYPQRGDVTVAIYTHIQSSVNRITVATWLITRMSKLDRGRIDYRNRYFGIVFSESVYNL